MLRLVGEGGVLVEFLLQRLNIMLWEMYIQDINLTAINNVQCE